MPTLIKKSTAAGFTLLEAVIYIALFMLVIGGGVLSSYQIFEGSAALRQMNILEAEANFLQRKFDWALNGAVVDTPTAGNSGDTLVVDKGGTEYEITIDGTGVVTLDGTPLSTENVTVSDLEFTHKAAAGGEPPALSFGFSVNGRSVGTTTRYVR